MEYVLTGLLTVAVAVTNFICSILVLQVSIKDRHSLGIAISASSIIILIGGMVIAGPGSNSANTSWQVIMGIALGLSCFPTVSVGMEWWEKGKAKPEPEVVPEPVKEPEPEPEPTPEEPAFHIKPELRTEHVMVVAGSGGGKTQLFQNLLLHDIAHECTVIVIDSQGQLIDNLLQVVAAKDLVHLTPTDKNYPLALNLFSKGMDSSLYEYIFNSSGETLTPKMATVYRYVSRLVSVIPGATLDTMRQILEENGAQKYQEYFPQLPPIARSFFETEFNDKRAYGETKSGVLRRLYSLLENDAFAAMFTSPENKLNLEREIYGQKIILIDTAKRMMKGETFRIFGRFFIAQIARAIFNRDKPYPHPVYIYIDEFADYVTEEDMIIELFTQARKFNVGMTVAFQFLAQLPDKALRAVLTNTATKVVGNVSAADRRTMANEIGINQEALNNVPKGRFLFASNGLGTQWWDVPLGKLERLGKRSSDELEVIRDRMRKAYSYQPSAETTEASAVQGSDPFADFEE
ncbi:hypothetical protein [Novosphingobium aquae]|uniref:Uncharacterized protein n=1 Tax=Novosphingobium aquae TaxID=3133435 RepID=A0ABU8SCA1_9SPHN